MACYLHVLLCVKKLRESLFCVVVIPQMLSFSTFISSFLNSLKFWTLIEPNGLV